MQAHRYLSVNDFIQGMTTTRQCSKVIALLWDYWNVTDSHKASFDQIALFPEPNNSILVPSWVRIVHELLHSICSHILCQTMPVTINSHNRSSILRNCETQREQNSHIIFQESSTRSIYHFALYLYIQDADNNGVRWWLIGLIAVGVVIVAVLIVILVWCIFKR